MTKNLKKLLVLVLAAALCMTSMLGALSVSAADGSNPTYTVDKVTGKAGDQVVVTVTGSDLTEICGQDVDIFIPDGLTVVKVEKGGASLTQIGEDEGDYALNDAEGGKNVKFVDIINFNDDITTAEFKVEITVEISADAAPGTVYDIKVSGVFADYDEEDVTVTVNNGSVTVADEEEHQHEWKDELTYRYDAATNTCYTERTCKYDDTVDVVAAISNPTFTHTLSLESNLAVNYQTAVVANYTDVYAVVTREVIDASKEDADVTLRVDAVVSGSNWRFEYLGVRSTQMQNNLAIQVFGTNSDGHVVLMANESNYSIVTYIKAAYNYYQNAQAGTANAAFRTLLVDLANYGAQAQTYFEYNVENLANKDIPQTYKSELPEGFSNILEQHGNITFTKSLDLSARITLNINIPQSQLSSYSDLSLKIEYENSAKAKQTKVVPFSEFTSSGSNYLITFAEMASTQLSSPFTVTLLEGSEDIGGFTYSIESYAAQVEGVKTSPSYQTLYTLAQYLMAYGKAAEAYFNFAA